MFAITLKQKEIDFHAKLMENRIKKLQDEEDRAMKKISMTLQRMEHFERIKEDKEQHRKMLDDYKNDRDNFTEEQRRKFLE